MHLLLNFSMPLFTYWIHIRLLHTSIILLLAGVFLVWPSFFTHEPLLPVLLTVYCARDSYVQVQFSVLRA